jgi:hypothetical protein
MQAEGQLTNDKMKRPIRDNQLKNVRRKEHLDPLALKRSIILLLCIPAGSFSLFLQGVNLLNTRPSSLFMLL